MVTPKQTNKCLPIKKRMLTTFSQHPPGDVVFSSGIVLNDKGINFQANLQSFLLKKECQPLEGSALTDGLLPFTVRVCRCLEHANIVIFYLIFDKSVIFVGKMEVFYYLCNNVQQ